VPSETISLTDAAERLGVHYMTAYRYVRTGRLPATKVGAEWRVAVSDVDALRSGDAGSAAVGGPPPAGPGKGRRRRHDYHVRLEDRLLAGDEAGAWAIIENALTAGVDPEEVYLEVLSPAMARIGEEWAAGQVSVSEEHRASVVMLRIIGRLGPRFSRRGRKRGTVVVGAPAGDHHGVPVALAADLLRGAGFTVIDLGADTPAASFVDAARTAERLIGVGISATHSGNEESITEAVETVHRDLGCPVVIGGQAIGEESVGKALGADEVTSSAPELIEVFGRLAAARLRAS
jgi:MerR family transcriptional regulator, light-induced transcriptional regulator